jgi:hypothetical protein
MFPKGIPTLLAISLNLPESKKMEQDRCPAALLRSLRSLVLSTWALRLQAIGRTYRTQAERKW